MRTASTRFPARLPAHRRVRRFAVAGGVALVLLLAVAAAATESRDTAPLGIILVSVDTLRADRLGCYGYAARPSSPHIDALAGDGVLFENFITSSPWTTPSHLSMLTSLQPVSHGLTASFGELWSSLNQNRDFFRLPEARVTLADALSQKGFATAAFTAGGPVAGKIGFDQGFDEYHATMYKLNEKNVGEMLAWIESNSDRPFFLFWHTFEAHAPYLHTDFVGDVLDTEQAARVRAGTEKIAAKKMTTVWPSGAMARAKNQIDQLIELKLFNRDVCEALYVGGVLSVDRWMERLTGFLRDKGLYDRTLILFTGDHGDEFADHSPTQFYNIHGHILYEEMVRVPLIVKLPGQRYAGARVPQVTRMIDLMPTVLDLASVRPEPDEMQGSSLRPYWTDASEAPGRTAITEACARVDEKKSVRTDRYKYIVTLDAMTVTEHGRAYLPESPPRPELYDLAEDPGEKRNLLDGPHDERVAAIAAAFYRQLQAYIDENAGHAEPVELDEETYEKIKALGYVDE